jgi:hypothetical protein
MEGDAGTLRGGRARSGLSWSLGAYPFERDEVSDVESNENLVMACGIRLTLERNEGGA